MRALLTGLAREERVTIFVSSHLLNEVEVLCNRVAILNRGRLIVQGKVAELLDTGAVRLELGVEEELEPALAALATLGHVTVARGKDPRRLVVTCPREETAALGRALVERGIGVTALIPRRPTLEEYFRERLAIPIDESPSGGVPSSQFPVSSSQFPVSSSQLAPSGRGTDA
jgi:ABC-2 type transport system ATP-binding protein